MANKKEEKITNEFKFEIIKHIGILCTNPSGWTKEVNVVKWNDAKPKMDIREWDTEHEKMSRGTSLNLEEIINLRDILANTDLEGILPV